MKFSSIPGVKLGEETRGKILSEKQNTLGKTPRQGEKTGFFSKKLAWEYQEIPGNTRDFPLFFGRNKLTIFSANQAIFGILFAEI